MLRIFALLALLGGTAFIAHGFALANGAGGACFGEWIETYDAETDTWKYDVGTFQCIPEPACPGPEICRKYTIVVHASGDKDKICACYGESSWQIDWVYEGHTPTHHCSATGHYPKDSGWANDASCTGACPEGTGECLSDDTGMWIENGQRKRKQICECR